MRRLLISAVLALVAAAPASAQEMSANVERVASLSQYPTAISINFIEDTMFLSTATGVYSFDVSDPAGPKPLGSLPMYIWENEDVDVDPVRKRLFISRDPRGFTSPASPGDAFPYGGVHIIDVSDPGAMTEAGFFLTDAGHTTTCVNACDFVWTAGPYANAATQPDFKGRPVYATDVTDPANPRRCPEPIATGHNDGVTDYVHDVQVDSRGVAWVSGAGGVRGYWTSGDHRNPLTGKVETATGCAPIPYGGSGTPDTATPSRFMHNAWRSPGPESAPIPARKVRKCRKVKRRVRRGGKRRIVRRRVCRKKRIPGGPAPLTLAERTLYGTEENVVSDCKASGRFVTYDLEGTFGGEGFRDTARTKHRMRVFDTWTPEGAEGTSGCDSAHYFTVRDDGISANAFYAQGVRFLDVSDPRDIRQVGWYRTGTSNTWAAYWHKGYVYVADFQRGIEVLKFNGGPAARTVRAPALRRRAAAGSLRFDRTSFGGLCPLR